MPTWHTPPWKMVMSPWPVRKAMDHLPVSPRACQSLIGCQCRVSPENDHDLTMGVTIALWAVPHGLTRWGKRELHQSHSTIYIYLCTYTWCALVHDIVCFETRSTEQRRSRHLILTVKPNIWCEVVECWSIFQHVMLTWDADMTYQYSSLLSKVAKYFIHQMVWSSRGNEIKAGHFSSTNWARVRCRSHWLDWYVERICTHPQLSAVLLCQNILTRSEAPAMYGKVMIMAGNLANWARCDKHSKCLPLRWYVTFQYPYAMCIEFH